MNNAHALFPALAAALLFVKPRKKKARKSR